MTNEEIARQYFEPFSGVDFKAPVEAAIAAGGSPEEIVARVGEAWSVLAPEIVWDSSPFAGGGALTVYSGYKAVGRDGLETGWRCGQACDIADGLITRMRVFQSVMSAREAVGAEA